MYRVVYQETVNGSIPLPEEPHKIVRSDGSLVGLGANSKEANLIMVELNKIAVLKNDLTEGKTPARENVELKEALAELQMALEELRIEKEEYRVRFVVASKRCRENFEQNLALRKALKEVL